jgi:hypothetical protein
MFLNDGLAGETIRFQGSALGQSETDDRSVFDQPCIT